MKPWTSLATVIAIFLAGCSSSVDPFPAETVHPTPTPAAAALPPLTYGTTATYAVTGPTPSDPSANQTIPRVTLQFLPGRPFPRADGLVIDTYSVQTKPTLWDHEGNPLLVYRAGLNRFSLDWTESVSALMETPPDQMGTPGEVRMDRYAEPGAVIPLLDPPLLGMYATLHLGFANATLQPTPTSLVRQEVGFGNVTTVTLTMEEMGMVSVEGRLTRETRTWILHQTYDAHALPLRIEAESRIQRGAATTVQSYLCERQDIQAGGGEPIRFGQAFPPTPETPPAGNFRAAETVQSLDGIYTVPPVGHLPWLNFTGALDAAIRQKQLGGSIGPAYLPEFAWLRGASLLNTEDGYSIDPTGTAKAAWFFAFIDTPVANAEKATMSTFPLFEHGKGAEVYVPGPSTSQDWNAVPGYDGPLGPLLDLQGVVDTYHRALGLSSGLSPDQVLYFDMAGFGFRDVGIHWQLASGCKGDDGRNPTVIEVDARTGWLAGAFYDGPYSGVNACDAGPLPF